MSGSAGIQDLFARAVELGPDARAAFVDDVAARDAALAAALRGLLASDAILAATTAQPVSAELSRLAASLGPGAFAAGQRVEAFELREQIGQGGMGCVFRAERVDGKVRQQVAIKFVRRELLDEHMLRRFQVERQLMASLDHPHIARLIDAAELDDGSPYFVMEYVDGVPVTDYCTRESLGVRARVALMRKVCAAVAAAHRELIVHRDLKPGNILIGRDGNPKLLDFGIAKPLAARTDESTTTQRCFSPQYAAPEQLTGAPVGTSCDIYALGLLLFEVLAGARPFELAGATPAHMLHLVTEVPAPAPSAIVASDPARAALARQLRGDLDGIVLRCLRKLPPERYGSVEQLEADLGHYLDGLPVRARGGHRWYRFHKFVRRNAVAVAAAGVAVVALFGGIVAFATQARIARERAAELEQVSRFQASMFRRADPAQAGVLLTDDLVERYDASLAANNVPKDERRARKAAFENALRLVNATDTARHLVDATILTPSTAAIDEEFGDQPLVGATLRQALASRYQGIGMNAVALPLQERALATRRELLGDDHADTLASMEALGTLLGALGRPADAHALLEAALDGRRRVLGDEHPDTITSTNSFSRHLISNDRFAKADPLCTAALATARRVLGDDHPVTLTSLRTLADLRRAQRQLPEAETLSREALARLRRIKGDDDIETVSAIGSLGSVLVAQGRVDEAEQYYREALATARRARGDEHPGAVLMINGMGVLLRNQNRLAEAQPYFEEALVKSRRVLGTDHPNTMGVANNLAVLLLAQQRPEDAEPLYREVLIKHRRVLGADHPDTIRAEGNLAYVLHEQGRFGDAEPYATAALARARRVLGPDDASTLILVSNLALVRVAQGRAADALALLGPAEPAFRRAFPGNASHRVAKFLMTRGRAYAALGEFAHAERSLLEAHALFTDNPGLYAKDRPACVDELAALYRAWHAQDPGGGHDDEGVVWQRRAESNALADKSATAPLP